MDKVRRALLGDRKAQAELTKKGHKLPCHVCGKKAKIMFREGLCIPVLTPDRGKWRAYVYLDWTRQTWNSNRNGR